MAEPAHGGAGGAGGGGAAAAIMNSIAFNDATAFDKLNCEESRQMQIVLYEINEDEVDKVEPIKIELAKELGFRVEDINYDPDTRRFFKEISMPICTLPVGSEIHRYDKEGAVDPYISKSNETVPIFFGNKSSVLFYSGKTTEAEINATRSSYRLKRPARLLHINTYAMKHFLNLLTPEDAVFFNDYCRIAKFPNSNGTLVEMPLIVPAEPYGTVAEIRKQDKDKRKPFNRRFAEIICNLGFDGWIVKPFNPDRQEGVAQITHGAKRLRLPDDTVVFENKEALKIPNILQARYIAPLEGRISPMPPEIVICRWDVFMDRIKGGSRRRRHTRRQPRRNRRAAKQSRRHRRR
jgi:hypothetical protein